MNKQCPVCGKHRPLEVNGICYHCDKERCDQIEDEYWEEKNEG